ncbi:RagB/SusD family nutrient uptake outer membrane protein [Dyadobacter pollutisoli]|uniref:RagB/SusD family nutrient uptake outer membrane protein n=1 Tax=Dyadobacter pollutisoli TaxID=2910158 RepID=A0A9E8NDJ9_9BACT|nr:RagB/SusD family nutrient uptake outer membrane protein [Dyadobacter pollutisoli]WAC13027.1 RagB/SusD family nutrient uptake outer membrane protein [Dyadobacter pollutisoli]
MKFKKYILALSLFLTAVILDSCSDSLLDIGAQGALSEEQTYNRAGVDALLVGAYAALDGQQFVNGGAQNLSGSNAWEAAPDNWTFGSIAGGDAHKGSDGSDQPAIDAIAKFSADPSNSYFNSKWRTVYEGINRANTVIRVLALVPEISDADRASLNGQARFLRGHYYFELKKIFNNVPWIDETIKTADAPKVVNTVDIWPNIQADFEYAYANLPVTQPEVGKVNKWAAGSYLAKTLLYQKKYAEAKTVFDAVIAQGVTSSGAKYALTRRFEDNFDAATDNSSESVFAIQMAANDGTNNIANANQGGMLNFPYGDSPFRCCGFFQPSQDLVNSYRTNSQTGLPYVDDYNTHVVKSDQGIASSQAFTPDAGNLDPRLDWTVGRRGLPYHDWGFHPGASWIRSPGQSYAGPYSPKKNIYWQATQDIYSDQSAWAPGTAINVNVIRYADVLLMAAEVEAQLNNLAQAQTYVNLVRARAADPASTLYKYVNDKNPLAGFSTTPAANYKIAVYPAGAFAGMGKDGALKAIYFERKIELAMEGHRFFDLVRWGIAQTALTAFFQYEGTVTTDVRGGSFIAGKNEYFPIPQRQIDLSTQSGSSSLRQNANY